MRFISVNDHFDTDEAHNENKALGVSLMNPVNDMYARDISRRIRPLWIKLRKRKQVAGFTFWGLYAIFRKMFPMCEKNIEGERGE